MKRVWIYQADRFFTEPEEAQALEILQAFVQDWTAHGNKLAGQVSIEYGLFVILQVDEAVANVTGCSIDKSVHLLKKIENELNINLFNRLLIAYKDGFNELQLVSNTVFQDLIDEGEVTEKTIVFNNMVTTYDEFEDSWEVPFERSWHSKVFTAKKS
ncbi:ABC transporter ATPase [Sphingobacterium hungaricum]|uniref:ABC transporter ATPase n=1 Tax=Sphingobacterium hungaricum TaxID=2082723 RepID=A0A928UYG2_9SPHI|nr:ABC transporter ATPase [Sphingobacterium hungaricum]MBE8713409.1 ABC transporter ATPase [Sphingobacterium hungaricum]